MALDVNPARVKTNQNSNKSTQLAKHAAKQLLKLISSLLRLKITHKYATMQSRAIFGRLRDPLTIGAKLVRGR